VGRGGVLSIEFNRVPYTKWVRGVAKGGHPFLGIPNYVASGDIKGLVDQGGEGEQQGPF